MQAKGEYGGAVLPVTTAEVELLMGEQVLELLADEGFKSGWDELYGSCPWATVFQSREFVGTWYKTYQTDSLPILIKAEKAGRITGLLPMALQGGSLQDVLVPGKGGRIIGAGHFEAEYQTWLAEGADEESFIKAALREIIKYLPRHDILFRYLPSNTPIDWLESDVYWQKRHVLEPFKRPLMDLSDPGIPKMSRKTEYRNKLNRLKRLGEVNFEQITDIAVFSSVLAELTVQYDFRQGAMFNKNQFRESPLKYDFLLGLFSQQLLHVTVLKSNGEIVAAIVALAGRGWVYLGGINVHTPSFAKQSPGFVHFIMLGQQLAQEGFEVFDLTPGGDFYKERMATKHDFVYELVVTNNPAFRIKRLIRKYIHQQVIKAGKRPMGVELALKKQLYLLKWRIKAIRQQGLFSLASKQVRGMKSPYFDVFQKRILLEAHTSGFRLNRDSLRDLLDYEASAPGPTRWEFLAEAMRRFEAGGHAYTWAAGGRLLACAWLGGAGRPEGAPLLEGLYCHPAGGEGAAAFLAAAAGEAAGGGQGLVRAAVPRGETRLRQALTEAGFLPGGGVGS